MCDKNVRTSTSEINPETEKYVSYIPPHLLTETFRFFASKPCVNALLKLIYSRNSSSDTTEDRREFTRRQEHYEEEDRIFNQLYRHQESKAEKAMWRALKTLPRDMYDEATQGCTEPLPSQLQFHKLYRKQILSSLSDYEEIKLQTFQNLMHVRFPFEEEKKKQPQLFWISQLGKLHRARIGALAKSLKILK